MSFLRGAVEVLVLEEEVQKKSGHHDGQTRLDCVCAACDLDAQVVGGGS